MVVGCYNANLKTSWIENFFLTGGGAMTGRHQGTSNFSTNSIKTKQHDLFSLLNSPDFLIVCPLSISTQQLAKHQRAV